MGIREDTGRGISIYSVYSAEKENRYATTLSIPREATRQALFKVEQRSSAAPDYENHLREYIQPLAKLNEMR
ncbi:hypothetical protein H6F76_26580 [Leptolyngbya sp. FACHB-321]|uniref:hypothetical protein n=1 Tax=Leptolyngbya sp. FACHB-321 TaxID=2692807 RepID=UPI001682A0E9|nr:hypothetical protein [Leptolyngbya sp. FACHB-321]MBD2038524.1 hypothetical protein [Leptolyngbya sp. FACHB-321]